MEYIDNISKFKLHHGWGGNFLKRCKVKHNCNELARNQEKLISQIYKLIQEIEAQIDAWSYLKNENSELNYNDNIRILCVLADFLRVNCRFALISLDIITAYKYIFSTTSDYEYRFFARRIYTLFYETRNGLINHVGKMIPSLSGIIDQQSLTIYKREHCEFTKFLNQHNEEFKYIRNTNEAHKGEEYEKQVESIEQLRVADSINLIQEGNVLLTNMNAAFVIVMGSLYTALNGISQRRNVNIQRDL